MVDLEEVRTQRTAQESVLQFVFSIEHHPHSIEDSVRSSARDMMRGSVIDMMDRMRGRVMVSVMERMRGSVVEGEVCAARGSVMRCVR